MVASRGVKSFSLEQFQGMPELVNRVAHGEMILGYGAIRFDRQLSELSCVERRATCLAASASPEVVVILGVGVPCAAEYLQPR